MQAITTQTSSAALNPLPTPPLQLVTTKQLAQMVPAYEGKPGAIRWQLFNAATNGLKESGTIIRHGRRVLIDIDKYFAWQVSNGAA